MFFGLILVTCVTEIEYNKKTELGDIALVAASRAIHMDILVFNTNKHISISPIEIICADHYEGGSDTMKT